MSIKNDEIDRNLARFLELLPCLIKDHEGEYVLLHDEDVKGFFPSAIDAQIAGNQQYADRRFSIQKVNHQPEELGYFSYALPLGVMAP